jgi:hypothetical protein
MRDKKRLNPARAGRGFHSNQKFIINALIIIYSNETHLPPLRGKLFGK